MQSPFFTFTFMYLVYLLPCYGTNVLYYGLIYALFFKLSLLDTHVLHASSIYPSCIFYASFLPSLINGFTSTLCYSLPH